MNIYLQQKIYVMIFIFIINLILSTTMIIYVKNWYVYLIFLMTSPLINSLYALALLSKLDFKKNNSLNMNYLINTNETNEIDKQCKNKTLVIFVPCYNETLSELISTFESISEQQKIDDNKKLMIIICDGIVKNDESVTTTDKLLTDYIFLNNITKDYVIDNAYKTWDGKLQTLRIYCGIKSGLHFMIIVKSKNYGKRDSITLLRRMIYKYVNNNVDLNKFDLVIKNEFDPIFNSRIDYIYGTDADTVLDPNCIYHLIRSIYLSDEDTVAVVGFVDVNISKKNPLILYQFAEYLYAQCLRRKFQSHFTNKVNCLSGCNQIVKVCNETCGEQILEIFNKKPLPNANIFNMIVSTASEDRNHVTLMFQLYPYIKTLQDVNAIVYTNVPETFNKFLIQRKRWTLGALCNDILLVLNQRHNIIERIQSFINIYVNIINTFILISSGYFINAIIHNSSLLMLYLAIPIFIVILHMLSIPFVHYHLKNTKIGYYYLSLPIYILATPVLSFIQHIYTLINLDNFNWNKKTIQIDNTVEETMV